MIIDDFPTWSPVADEIAFQRNFTSQYGLAGVYVIRIDGSAPTRIAEPLQNLVFSPDGTRIAAMGGGSIVVLDRKSFTITTVLHTDNNARDPDWSADGRRIVYARHLLSPEEPRDSAGIHIVDLDTGVDGPLRHEGGSILGGHPAWSPADTLIAYIGVDGAYVVRPDGSRLARLAVPGHAIDMSNPQWIEGGRRLLVNDIRESRTYAVDVTTGSVSRWPSYLGGHSAISPSDSAFVIWKETSMRDDLKDLTLSIRRMNDVLGIHDRRLTTYEPATPHAARHVEAP